MAEQPGAYIHIPFCRRKCDYCAFNSWPLPVGAETDVYLKALAAEMAAETPRPVRTVYIGGGTPTCLSAKQLAGLLSACRTALSWTEGTEVTVEANPGTLDAEKLSVLREYGVNRLSLGLQSTHDRLLARIGRIHNYADFLTAWDQARAAGFTNLSVDLMFGLPEQSLADWESTLAAVVALQPEHISAYSLTVEPGTPFARQKAAGMLDLPGEETENAMFAALRATLPAAGYEAYEVANFARPGYRSQHNQIYWRNEEYYGFGAGAYSFRAHCRCANLSRPDEYAAAVLGGQSPITERERISREMEMAETALMGLRLADGIDLAAFAARFGCRVETVYAGAIERCIRSGLLQYGPNRLALTERGLWVANRVALEFLPE